MSRKDRCILFLAQGFGLGLLRPGPGTWGSLLALPLAWGLHHLHLAGQLAILMVLAGIGVPICTRAGELLGKHDPGSVVWDEIVACAAVLLLLPINWLTLLLAFVLFRIFDISKPWPIRRVEHLPRGWGVMADDFVAAIYAQAALRLTLWLLGQMA